MEICGDNRFEIIAKAKAHLLEATNIDTSEDEMKVLDSFLFRCWQMGWLDRYAEQTEPNSSEKPNNCEGECDTCRYSYITCRFMDKGEPCNYEPKTEPQNDVSCFTCIHDNTGHIECQSCDDNYSSFEPKDEPQTDCSWKKGVANDRKNRYRT